MKKTGIVICNYNKAEALEQCIMSVLESSVKEVPIYVVDNASTDHSLNMIQDKFEEQVILLANKINLGGSGGFNTGLRRAMQDGCEYIMCMDDDAMVDEKAIEILYDFLEEHIECGIACSKVYHLNTPDIVQQYGITIDFDRFCVVSPYEGRVEDGTMPDFVYCDAVPACSLMVRREVIEKIGFLPEENFLYWDDTKWCYLCNQAGWKVACVGASKALHAMGAKKESINTFPTYYAWRNWLTFFMEYTPDEKREKLCDSFLNSLYVMVYESLYNGEKGRVKTVMAAYDDALHNVMGRAENGIIESLHNDDTREKIIAKTYQHVNFVCNGYEQEAQRIASRICKYNKDMQVTFDSKEDCACTVVMCNYIFDLEDLSRAVIYADIDDNLLLTDEDVFWVMNYGYGRDTFINAQRDLFLRKSKKIKKG